MRSIIRDSWESTHDIEIALVTKIETVPPTPAGTIAENPDGGD